MYRNIQLIAPYYELADLAESIKKELGWGIQIELGNLEDGIALAQTAELKGAEAIISRGGTATIIKKHTSLPVIEIKVTGYDLLNVLYPYQNNKKAIGIVGYKNVIEGCKTICNLLNISFKEVVIPNEGNAHWDIVHKKVLHMIQENEIEIIIGDTVVASKFKEIGIEFKLIVSGRESILQAVEEAHSVMQAREKEKEKSESFKAVLDFIDDAVVATDEFGIITVANLKAEKMFHASGDTLIGKPVTKIVKGQIIGKVLDQGISDVNQIMETPSGKVISNTIPIHVGTHVRGLVATFQKISNIQNTEQKIREALYSKGLVTRYQFKDIITKDPRTMRLIEIAKEYAKTDATILISGESGTGKEIIAQSIHATSHRAQGPFVAINCAALPTNLLESELFGYVEGAFTGAKKGGKIGLFELAHNGTILLDEIGEMEKHLQARLLRVFQEKQVMRLGSDKIVPVNIHIIAATNANLMKLVAEGKFREDLYYRLSVLNLKSVPLRDRKCDIELLGKVFLDKFNKVYHKSIKGFNDEVLDLFYKHSWPGNIREFRNIVERIVISTNEEMVGLYNSDLQLEELMMMHLDVSNNANASVANQAVITDELLEGSLQDIKLKIIKKVLQQENYNKSRTAKRLQIDRSTLGRLL